jgi:hypothetical protein
MKMKLEIRLSYGPKNVLIEIEVEGAAVVGSGAKCYHSTCEMTFDTKQSCKTTK